MSATTGASFDVRKQIVRIDRSIEEIAKFRAEAEKLHSEAAKLNSESAKLNRDQFFAPIVAAGALAGAVAALLPMILRAWGVHP